MVVPRASKKRAELITDELTAVDLFCGLGGMSEGFQQAGFKVLFANDIEAEQVETYASNHAGATTSTSDIRGLSADTIFRSTGLAAGQLDVVLKQFA